MGRRSGCPTWILKRCHPTEKCLFRAESDTKSWESDWIDFAGRIAHCCAKTPKLGTDLCNFRPCSGAELGLRIRQLARSGAFSADLTSGTASAMILRKSQVPLKEETVMLVLTRKVGESIVIGGGIRVTVTALDGNKVRLGIEAPPEVRVDREEVARRLREFAADAVAESETVPV
jgi:carbon storage regulator